MLMSLSEIIKQKIKEDGPISFCEFMEMALYYPCLGYYTSDRDKIGWQGDYYTSPYITTVFGEMVAKQLEEMWQILGKGKFTIVEYGAGTGCLASGILAQLKNNREFYEQLNYCIIEKSDAMCQKEKGLLKEKVSWHQSIKEISPVTGCILSNELIDNFSVHQVMMEDELMEVLVDFDNDFFELLKPASNELKVYLEELKVILKRSFRTEINLHAIEWIKEIEEALHKGFVLTVDYGFPSYELYSDKRSTGTLLCYHHHTINDCPYRNIGDQDITAHVNFSALYQWGLKNGLEYTGFTNQAYFLLALGLTDHIRRIEQTAKQSVATDEKALLINSLLMDMGTKLKILIQHKNISTPQLSGLRFPLNLFYQ
jgi:SAM-dependent MidA family methyltransferase